MQHRLLNPILFADSALLDLSSATSLARAWRQASSLTSKVWRRPIWRSKRAARVRALLLAMECRAP